MMLFLACLFNIGLFWFYKRKEKQAMNKQNWYSSSSMTSKEAAFSHLKHHGVKEVTILPYKKNFYDWKTKTVYVEATFFEQSSVFGYAVATHEASHAIQHHRKTFLSILRILTLVIRNVSFLLLSGLLYVHLFGQADVLVYLTISFAGISSYYWVCFFHEKEANRIALSFVQTLSLPEEEVKGIQSIQNDLILSYAVNMISCLTMFVVLLT